MVVYLYHTLCLQEGFHSLLSKIAALSSSNPTSGDFLRPSSQGELVRVVLCQRLAVGNVKTTVLIVDMERKDKNILQIQNSILKGQKDQQTTRDGSNKK